MKLCCIVLSLCAIACARPAPKVAPAPKPLVSQNEVLAVLTRRCGECHQSSQKTALPAALAVFDLDDPNWPERFDARRFTVAAQRLGDTPASDRALFVAFHSSRTPTR